MSVPLRPGPACALLLTLLLAAPAPAGETLDAYRKSVQQLESQRSQLEARWRAAPSAEARAALLDEARELVFTALATEIIPAWYGTPWDFYGSTEEPGTGAIACGYFVGTVLAAAGFQVDRIELGDQASEHIVRTFAGRSRVKTLWKVPVSDVVAHVESLGRGIYPVGLSFHTGLLVHDGEQVRFCHSAYYDAGRVTCEEASTSPGLDHSGIFVIGPLMTDRTMTAWIEGRRIRTHGR